MTAPTTCPGAVTADELHELEARIDALNAMLQDLARQARRPRPFPAPGATGTVTASSSTAVNP